MPVHDYIQTWLDDCPVKWEVNDVIDGAIWVIAYNAMQPDELEEEEDEEDV